MGRNVAQEEIGINRVGVAGFGTMGFDIAFVSLLAGYAVTAYETSAKRLQDAHPQMVDLIRGRKRLPEEEREKIIASFKTTEGLEDLSECDLVIEAVFEDLDTKKRLFRRLGDLLNPTALVSTNTSSLSVGELGGSFRHPENFIGLHFFNPARVMRLVEVVPSDKTSRTTIETALSFVESIGKRPVLVKDRPGFIVNRALVVMVNEALRILEEGGSGVQEIDEAMKLGAGWAIGPFALADVVGLDIQLNATRSLYRAYGEGRFEPSHLLERLVSEGHLGKKSGRGFYEYDTEGNPKGENPDLSLKRREWKGAASHGDAFELPGQAI